MSDRTALLYRMATKEHICPSGLKAKALLESRGFTVVDHALATREETDDFKQKHAVETTPQIWIDGNRIGGYDQLRSYFGEVLQSGKEPTYAPVIALFGMAAVMAVALAIGQLGAVFTSQTVIWFFAFAMCLLALQKLRDIESFSNTFLTYDLLAQRWVPYAYIYPFAEGIAGILMLSGMLMWVAAPISLVIGGIGAASVYKAVYMDKRDLTCACVGGNTNVPLGPVSLAENVMMIGMGLWMLLRLIGLA